jgi:hypothetical protein
MLIVSFGIHAQQGTPAQDGTVYSSDDIVAEDHLDQALPTIVEPPDIMSIHLVNSAGNVFSRFDYTVLQILQDILSIIDQTNLATVTDHFGGHTHPLFAPEFTAGDTNQMRDDLDYLLNTFPQSGEVFSNSLAVGEKSFIDQFGFTFTTSEPELFTPLPFDDTFDLTFFAGRNTAAAPSLDTFQQLEIVVQSRRYNIFAFDTTTPIVLDMDGDNQLQASGGQWLPHELSAGSNFVEFDMNGDGVKELVEWTGANDGILITYNGEKEVNGHNLFGDAGEFANGYQKLATLDRNGDQVLTGEELSTLSVWQDRNGNATVDSGEVISVNQLGITQIHTSHSNMVSSFTQNGQTKVMWDWHPVTVTR